MSENAWVVIQRETQRPLILHAAPIAEETPSDPRTVVIFLDLGATPRPSQEALKNIFSLTLLEARLAV